MASSSNYKTKQREIMLSYLESRPGVHITAEDVYEHFRAQGVTIGQSTVYRQLEKFVAEGLLNKYVLESGSSACFEYVGMTVHKKNETCFHCKCEKCGKLIHLKCEELEEIGQVAQQLVRGQLLAHLAQNRLVLMLARTERRRGQRQDALRVTTGTWPFPQGCHHERWRHQYPCQGRRGGKAGYA